MEQGIVVGLDGTRAGRAAIRWALERAHRLGRAVELVHVVDDDWGVVGERSLEELHPDVDRLVRESLSFAHEIAPAVPVRARVLTGDPMVELAEAARAAEIVVVGTHKTGFIHGQSFGSRSLQLAGIAWSPVAVIPEGSFGSRGGVLVGVDDTEAGRAAIAFGVAEAQSSEQALTFLRGLDDRSRSAIEDGLVTTVAKAMGYTGAIRSRVTSRPAAEALVDAASMARLLVVGSSRRRGAQLAALGPVCHDVLLNITSPTVIVHGDLSASLVGASEGARSA